MAEISFDDFMKVDIRVGTIVDAQDYPEARKPAFKLWVDFGGAFGVKKTSAQITKHYQLHALVGRQVAAVVNFPAKQIGKFPIVVNDGPGFLVNRLLLPYMNEAVQLIAEGVEIAAALAKLLRRDGEELSRSPRHAEDEHSQHD